MTPEREAAYRAGVERLTREIEVARDAREAIVRAARDYRYAETKYGGGLRPEFASKVRESGEALDALLAILATAPPSDADHTCATGDAGLCMHPSHHSTALLASGTPSDADAAKPEPLACRGVCGAPFVPMPREGERVVDCSGCRRAELAALAESPQPEPPCATCGGDGWLKVEIGRGLWRLDLDVAPCPDCPKGSLVGRWIAEVTGQSGTAETAPRYRLVPGCATCGGEKSLRVHEPGCGLAEGKYEERNWNQHGGCDRCFPRTAPCPDCTAPAPSEKDPRISDGTGGAK